MVYVRATFNTGIFWAANEGAASFEEEMRITLDIRRCKSQTQCEFCYDLILSDVRTLV